MLLIPLITQSTWIAYLSGFTCNRSSPTEPASENGSKSERARCKKCVGNIARLHRFRFCSADITPTVYWLDYRKVNFVSLFKGRGKLIKLLKVKSETERKLEQVRYRCIEKETVLLKQLVWRNVYNWLCSCAYQILYWILSQNVVYI